MRAKPDIPPIDERLLLELTEPRFYERGLDYFLADRVVMERIDADQVTAQVHGTSTYRVQLHWKDGTLHGQCNCPVGQAQIFCKHQVAVALAWAGGVAEAAPSAVSSGPPRPQHRQQPQDEQHLLRQWLTTQPPQALQALLLEAAETDPELGRKLLAQARLAQSPKRGWRKAIASLLGRRRFLDYHAGITYARRLEPLGALLQQALTQDTRAALDLLEYTLTRLFAIYQDSDDSNGDIGVRLRELAALHPPFAQSARPSDLARRVFKLRRLDDWSLLPPLDDYGDALGTDAIESLQKQALDALMRDGAKGPRHHFSGERLAAGQLLEETARRGGDVQAMLDAFAHLCHSGWEHLEMSRRCREHGRQREAIGWLERGVKIAPEDARLPTALAEAYTEEGFADEALQMRWQAFRISHDEADYLALREAAQAIGPWPPWRERALDEIAAHPRHHAHPSDTCVRLLLAEGEHQQAWDHANDAQARLSPATWERLAPAIEDIAPDGALRIYRTLVGIAIGHTQRKGYLTAIRWLAPMQRLHQRQETLDAFDGYLDVLRQTHRAKRSFVGLLDKAYPRGN